MFLVGGNEAHRRAVGIDTHAVKMICFMLSGMAASLAGIIASRGGPPRPPRASASNCAPSRSA
jgi:ribose/xylose/arabinose/galactoside ABC-type transport system permease subunit